MGDDVKQPLREAIADHAHRVWTKWLSYMFGKGVFNDNGTWTLPKDFVDRWTAQMSRKYKELSEQEKESDRRIADQYLAIFWLLSKKEKTDGK
jgi:hypothetical protein